jgi:diadenosine tetraphosphate (Ap4A) HIT family hydrolase
MADNCIFCKIVKGILGLQLSTPSVHVNLTKACLTIGDIPSLKVYENEKTLAFLDINPLS